MMMTTRHIPSQVKIAGAGTPSNVASSRRGRGVQIKYKWIGPARLINRRVLPRE
jgi:hypothetical protein